MIESFRHRGLKRLYERDDGKRIAPELLQKVKRILSLLDAATEPEAMNLPGYDFHALKGNLKGYWSVTVSGNWRIVFGFEGDNAKNVDLIDYH